MRVIICGDRHWNNYSLIAEYVKTLPLGSVIIQGECPGADKMARNAGFHYGYEVLSFPAKWEEHGDAAGPIRNRQMIKEGSPIDLVVAFHDHIDMSRGTRDMLKAAKQAGIPTELRTSR